MKKKYIAPSIKVRKVECTSLLGGSNIDTGISDKPATGGGRAKGNSFFDNDNEPASSSIWDE